MKTVECRITEDGLQRISQEAQLIAGSVGTHCVKFIFDEDALLQWDGLTMTAVFKAGMQEFSCALLNGTLECVVPHEVMECAGVALEVGVFGSDKTGALVIPTRYAMLCSEIAVGANQMALAGTEPTPSAYQQYVNLVTEAVEDVHESVAEAEDAADACLLCKQGAQESAHAAQSCTQTVELRAQAALEAADAAENYYDAMQNLQTIAPYIGENGNWYVWDTQAIAYVDSGLCARGESGADGINGQNGTDGMDGQDGVNGQDGADGIDGEKGDPTQVNGKSGASITLTASDLQMEGYQKASEEGEIAASDTIAQAVGKLDYFADAIVDGAISVGEATHAQSADTATNAAHATTADSATNAMPITGGTVTGDLTVEGTFMVGSANVISNGGQELVLRAGAEADFGLFLGVKEADWRFCSDIGSNINLGGESNRWKTIYSLAAVNVSSDRRLKKDIAPLGDAYADAMLAIEPKSYHMIADDAELRLGFIAQEVEDAMNAEDLNALEHQFLHKSESGEYSLCYEHFIPMLTALCQRQQREIDALEERIAVLENAM